MPAHTRLTHRRFSRPPYECRHRAHTPVNQGGNTDCRCLPPTVAPVVNRGPLDDLPVSANPRPPTGPAPSTTRQPAASMNSKISVENSLAARRGSTTLRRSSSSMPAPECYRAGQRIFPTVPTRRNKSESWKESRRRISPPARVTEIGGTHLSRTSAAGTVGAPAVTSEHPLTRSLPPRPARASSDEPRDPTPDPTSSLRGSNALDQLPLVTDIEIMYADHDIRWRCTRRITWGINRRYRLEHYPRQSLKPLDGPAVRGSAGLPDSLDHKRIITSGRVCSRRRSVLVAPVEYFHH